MKSLQIIFLLLLTSIVYAQPSNDNCATATTLQFSSTGYLDISYNFSNTSQSVGVTASKFFSVVSAIEEYSPSPSFTGRDVWYTFNTGTNNVVESFLDVFQDCTTPLASMGHREYYEPYQYSVLPNTDYYILVSELAISEFGDINYYPSNQGYYNFVRVSLFNIPTNLSCATAETIPQPLIGQTVYINNEGENGFDDRFYMITPTSDIIVESILTFEEECVNEIYYFDDSWYSFKSTLSEGVTYYTTINTTDGPISIEGISEPANGSCDAAEDLVLNNSVYFDPDFYDDQGSGPLQFNGDPVAYYNFVAPSSGVVKLSGGQSGETVYIYENCLSATHITDANFIWNNLTPGATYVLAINTSDPLLIALDEIGEVANNDECDNAELVIPGGSSVPFSFIVSDALVTQSEIVQNFAPQRTIENDLWYQCGPVSSGMIRVSGSDFVRLEIWKIVTGGDCTSIEPFGDVSSGGTFKDVPIGEDFLIRQFTSLEIEGSLSVNEVSNLPAATNDLCSNVIDIELRTSYSLSDMLDATYTDFAVGCSSGNRDLWFRHTTTEAQTINIVPGSNVSLYKGEDCNTLELITCYARDHYVSLEANTSYYFRVIPRGARSNVFRVNNSSQSISTCDNAEELSLLATSSDRRFYGYEAGGTKGSCWDNRDRSGWFEFTTTEDAYLFNMSSGQALSIYTGSCDVLTEVYCTDSYNSVDLIELLPSTAYKLYTSSGQFRYSITASPPAEDECDEALAIVINEEWQIIEASYEVLTESNNENSNCNFGPDYWLSFTVPASGIIECKKDGSGVKYVGLYATCNSNEAVACNQLSTNRPRMFKDMDPGSTMLLRTDAIDNSLLIRTVGDPQTNGSCAAATTIVSDDCVSSYTGNSYNNDEGVWYTIDMPASQHLLFTKQVEFDFNIYYGTCGSLTEYQIEDLEVPSVYGLSEGTIIYINVSPDQSFSFCCSEGPAITYSNQVCQNSEDIGNLILNECLSLNLEVSPVSGDGLLGSNIANEQIELWYECIMIGENVDVSIESFSSFNAINTRVNVYDDCAGESISNIELDGSTKTLRGLTIGSTLYFKVESSIDPNVSTNCDPTDAFYDNCIQTQFDATSFGLDLCVRALPMPAANDICDGATPISLSDDTCNNAIIDNTLDAYDDKYNCLPASRELFFSFTPDVTQSVEVSISDVTVPMTLSYFEGGCMSSERGCSEGTLLLTLNEGVEYLFAVSPLENNSNSDFTICIKEIVTENSDDNVGVNVSNPIQPLHVNGAIAVGNNDLAFPGSIRYTGTDFEGATQEGWRSLTQGQGQQNNGDDMGSHTATRSVNMNDNRLTDLSSPIAPQDATNKTYVDQQITALNTELQRVNSLIPTTTTDNNVDPFGGGGSSESDNLGNHIAERSVDLSNNRITNLAGPISNQDAVPKEYVDNLVTILTEQISGIDGSSTSNTNQGGPGGSSDNLGNHSATQQLNMGDNQIRNLPSPIAPDNAATKEYVDVQIESVENSINQLSSEEDVMSDLIENVSLDGSYVDGERKFSLDVETNQNSFSVDVSNLYNGWSYEKNGDAEEVFTEDIDVIIDTKLEVSRFGFTRFGADSGNVMDVYSEGINFQFDLYHLEQDQYYPLFQIGNYLQDGNEPSFNFEPDQALLGIGTIPSEANFHISHGTGHDFIKMEKLGTVKTVFDNDGYLGIGITDPQKEIDVNGGIQVITDSNGSNFQLNLIESNTGYARLNMTNSSGKDITFAALPSATTANSKLNFYIEDAGDIMTVAGSKRVGINDNSPDYTLDVVAQGTDDPFRVGNSSASETFIKVIDNGDIGIGGDPLADLHLNHSNSGTAGGFRLENKSAAAGEYWRMYVSSSNNDLRLYNGTSTTVARGEFDYASGVYTSASDRRLKSSIKNLHFDWDSFMQLRPTNYYFKSDEVKRTQLGLIAQEVEEVYPELVHYNQEEDTYKLDYSGTGVVAIKAVQELKKELESEKEKNEKLTEMISRMDNRLKVLESKK